MKSYNLPKMDSDPFLIKTKATNVDSVFDNKIICSKFFVCVLCVFCVSLSVYSAYRENALESRVNWLEEQIYQIRQQQILSTSTADKSSEENVNLVQRLRREIEAQFQQRIQRDVAVTERRILMEAQKRLHSRFVRDVQQTTNECSCPAGKQN